MGTVLVDPQLRCSIGSETTITPARIFNLAPEIEGPDTEHKDSLDRLDGVHRLEESFGKDISVTCDK